MQEQAEHLIKLVEEGDFPHLLVYGPPGAGKKVYSNKKNLSYIITLYIQYTEEKPLGRLFINV
jgi:replication-associated recombination protein RarA